MEFVPYKLLNGTECAVLAAKASSAVGAWNAAWAGHAGDPAEVSISPAVRFAESSSAEPEWLAYDAGEGLVYVAGRESFCERVNRFDQRQRCKASFVHHAIGVNHLQHTVVEFGCAGDVAHFAFGQQLVQIIAVRIEIGQCDVAGVVARVDAIGRTRATRGAGPVLADCHFDGNHLTRLYIAQFWPGPPVGRARWQVEQEVDNARRFTIEQPRIKLLELRSNAGKAGERGKQGV